MTVVPLPASPCCRVRLVYNNGAVGEGGNRFYLSYSGAAPTGANCQALATSIAGFWETDIAPLVNPAFVLNEVDVLDIATNSGLSGQWTGSNAGTRIGTPVPVQCCTNVEFGISRRYRGGKPRLYLPPANDADKQNEASWTAGFITTVNTNVLAFFTAIKNVSVGSMGTLAHVNLSYYKGFTNVTNSSGRERAVPTYRDAALVDPVTGYFGKAIMGSQRRRRTSTTP